MALRGVLTHRKTRRLARLLEIPPCFALGILESLWHTAAEQTPRGDIGALSDQDIADELFYEGEAERLVDALVDAGWLDRSDEYRLVIHDWSSHADSYVHSYLAKRTLLFADGVRPNIPHDAFNAGTRARINAEYEDKYRTRPGKSEKVPDQSGQVPAIPVPVPVPVPEPVVPCSEREESLETIPKPNLAKSDVSPMWLEWLRVYPKRNGDRKCASGEKKFLALLKAGIEFQALLDGVKRYRAWCDAMGKTGTEGVQQITTWLNGKAWEEPWEIPLASRPKTMNDKLEELMRA